jgi:hypothetical protein
VDLSFADLAYTFEVICRRADQPESQRKSVAAG